MSNNCNNGYVVLPNVYYSCKSCGTENCSECVNDIRQRRIWNSVRVPSSLYSMNLSSLNVNGNLQNKPKLKYGNVNWNQMSDRAVPGIQLSYIPSRGNSLRGTLTSNKPGGSGPGGVGVDVKHDSYIRYLHRKKANNIKTNKKVIDIPKYGNKEFSYGIIRGCKC